MSVNQNVPTCVASGTNNGCRPNPTYANNSQYSSVGESNYHGLHVSLSQRTTRWGQYRVSYTLSKSMNNLGEAFFSSPIDPTDLSKDWGRSDNDQRHRLVVNGSAQAPRLPDERHAAGLLGAAVQHHLRRDDDPGHRGAADRQRRSSSSAMPARARRSSRSNARISRTFRLSDRWQFEVLAEGFNLTNRANVVTRNANFGAGAYPTNPVANVRPDHRRRRAALVPVRRARAILIHR